MDIGHIPKSFWNAASFSLVVFTTGFLYLSYNFGDLNIKFKELEVRTTDALTLETALEGQKNTIQGLTENLNQRDAELAELDSTLQRKLAEIKSLEAELANLDTNQSNPLSGNLSSIILAITEDAQFDQDVTASRAQIDVLSGQQQQQQDALSQQQRIFDQQQQIQLQRPL